MNALAPVDFNVAAYHIYSPIAAGLILIFLIWSYFRGWSAAFGVALICWWGLGPSGVGPLRYSIALYLLSMVVLARMGWHWVRTRGRFVTRPWLMPGSAKLLVVLFAVIWGKSCVDMVTLGFDDYRRDAIYSLILFTLPGAVVMAGAFATQPWQTVVRQMLLSGLFIGGVYFILGIAGAVAHEPAILFLQGSGRMTLHNIDTINAVRFAPIIVLGLFYFVLLRISPTRITVASAGLCALAFVLFLVGTRQIVVSVLAVIVCALFVMRRPLIAAGILGLSICAAATVVHSNLMTDSPLVTRVVAVGESGDGRMGIWREAYDFTMEQPLLGGGFRSFGAFAIDIDAESGEISISRTNAHGMFQDAFTDHGVIVGLLLLVLCAVAVADGIWIAARRPEAEAKVAGLVPLALWSSLFFSGALYSSWGFYFGLVVYAGTGAGTRRGRSWVRWTRSRTDVGPVRGQLSVRSTPS